MRREIIGSCTLYCGDCFDILPEITGADCVITDPPYFLSLANDTNGKLNPWANLSNGSVFIKSWLEACLKKMPEDSAIWSFTNWQGFASFQKAGWEALALIRSLLVWNKMYPGTGMIGLRQTYELICLFVHGDFKIQNRSARDIYDCSWSTTKPNGHPAEKPVKLLKHLILLTTRSAQVILDPFMGSGSTGVAAVSHGRAFIGIEQDERWFDVACRRIEQAYQERSLLDVAKQEARHGA